MLRKPSHSLSGKSELDCEVCMVSESAKSGYFKLLFPEWQGYGSDARLTEGAQELAENLFSINQFFRIRTASFESLEIEHGVAGLSSIAALCGEARALLKQHQPSRVFMIGGTCATEIAPVTYLNESYSGQLAVIWFDAHGDLNTPSSSPSGHFHGMSLRTLLGEGPEAITSQIKKPLKPDQVFLVGSRDLDPEEEQFIDLNGVHYTSGHDDKGAKAHLFDALKRAAYRRIYIHIDVDVFNPFSFKDSLMPTPGGYTMESVASIIRDLDKSFEIVGVSLVEFCKRTDTGIQLLRQFIIDAGLNSKVGGL